MKILLAPDAFKGSLTAFEAACAIREGLLSARPDLDVVLHPMADGGEGTLTVLATVLGGECMQVDIAGMDGASMRVPVLQFTAEGQKPAWLIESAQVIGLTLPAVQSIPVPERTTSPVGRLIRMGLDEGIHCFYLALGGSATNDGGIGMLSELGMQLHNIRGETLAPSLFVMADVEHIDVSGLDARLSGTEMHLILDVDNPLLGAQGATLVYGPQKGVAASDLAPAESSMACWAQQARAAFECELAEQSGAGAAGGLGYAFLLLGATAHRGAAFVAHLSRLEEHVKGCDWVITGEGRSDVQTLRGKVPVVVGDCARHAGIPVCLMAGSIEEAGLFDDSFDELIQVAPQDMPRHQAMAEAHDLLAGSAEFFARRCL